MKFTVPYQIIREEVLEVEMVRLASTLVKICPKSYDSNDMVEYFYDNMEEILTEFGLPEDTCIDEYVAECIIDDAADDLQDTIESILKGDIVIK